MAEEIETSAPVDTTDQSTTVSRAEFDEMQGHLNKLRTENEGHRKGKADAKAAADDAQARADDAAKLNGRFEELAKSQGARLEEQTAELESLRQKASQFDADNLARQSNLSSLVESLSASQKALVEKGGTLADREALASHFAGGTIQNSVVDGVKNVSIDSNPPAVDVNDPAVAMAMSNEDFAKHFGTATVKNTTGIEGVYPDLRRNKN